MGRPYSPLLPPQNFKVTMETDELQRRIAELCDINADLQVPFPFNAKFFLHFVLDWCSLCFRHVVM